MCTFRLTNENRDVEYLESLVKEIEKGIDGQRITIDEDEKMLPS